MKALSIITESLDLSQKSVLFIHNINKVIKSRPDFRLSLYYQELQSVTAAVHIPCMHLIEAWGANNTMLAIDIGAAMALNKINAGGKLFYYPQQLDWIQQPKNANFYMDIYQNDSIELIARSESYYNVLSKVWKKPACIIRDFNHDDIISFIEENC